MNARRGIRNALYGIAAACLLAAGMGTRAADEATTSKPAAASPTLKIAWLRPAAAGMPAAQAYVDIVSTSDLELVGATTPFAKKIELVQVTMNKDVPEEKVVASMPVPAGKTTRLAFKGSHLRLVDITKDFGNGMVVPLTLSFKSADGKEVTAAIDAQVRGLLSPQQMRAIVPGEAAPAKETPSAGAKKEPAPAGAQ